jgi:uncharacterized protein YhaN
MRFVEFNIEGFGQLKNVTGRFPPGLSLILGENESGKTTLMNFFRYCLFGCPDGRSNRNLYLPLDGGNQRGQLTIEAFNGESLCLSMNGKKISFSEKNRKRTIEDILGYIDQEAYERIFAIGLEDMQKIKPLNEQAIQSRFFSAGAGLGTASLPAFISSLLEREKKLYKEQGRGRSSTEVNILLEKIRGANKRIESLQQYKDEYLQKKKEIEANSLGIEKIRKELSSLYHDVSLVEWAEKARTPWVEMLEAQKKLKKIQFAISFPDDGCQRFLEMQNEEIKRKEELEELETKTCKLEERLKEFDLPSIEKVLQCKESIRSISQDRNRIVREEECIKRKGDEIEDDELHLVKKIKELCKDWTVNDLESLDVSFSISKKGSDIKEKNDKLELQYLTRNEALEQAQKELEGKKSLYLSHENQVEKRKEQLPPMSVEEIKKSRSILRQIVKERDQLQAQMEAEAKNIDILLSKMKYKNLSFLMILLGFVMLVLGFFGTWSPSFIVGSTLFVAAFTLLIPYIRAKREIIIKEDFSSSLQKRDKEQEKEFLRRLQEMNFLSSPQESVCFEEVEEYIDSCFENVQAYLQSLQLRDAFAEEVASCEKKMNHCQRELDETADLLHNLRQEWTSFLEETGSPKQLKIEHWSEFESHIKQLRQNLEKIKEMKKDYSSSQEYIEKKRRQLQTILEVLPLSSVFENSSLVSCIDTLTSLLDETELQKEKLTAIKIEKEQLIESHKRNVLFLSQIQESKLKLFEETGVRNENEFTNMAEKWQEAKKLKEAIENNKMSLLAISGGKEHLEQVLSQLEKRSPAEAHLYKQEKEEKKGFLADKLEELNQKQGHLKNRLEELEKNKELGGLFLEREALTEELRRTLKEWLSVVICRYVLEQTRQKHEKERQPEVFKKAGKYLQLMTDDRYTLLSTASEQGGFSVELEEKNGLLRKKEDIWSSGLADQVYLSIRLALATLYGKRMEPLPLVLDDVLVRFDEKRQIGALKALMEIALHQQVLLFSCRRDLVNIFYQAKENLENNVSVFTMNNGSFSHLEDVV